MQKGSGHEHLDRGLCFLDGVVGGGGGPPAAASSSWRVVVAVIVADAARRSADARDAPESPEMANAGASGRTADSAGLRRAEKRAGGGRNGKA